MAIKVCVAGATGRKAKDHEKAAQTAEIERLQSALCEASIELQLLKKAWARPTRVA